MAFDIRDRCPFCNEQDCITIESRISKTSRRRRKECQSCKTRHTSHEVSEEFFEQAIENQRLITHLIEKLKIRNEPRFVPAVKSFSVTCDSCVHMMSSGCSFDFPEAGDGFAEDCSMYYSVK
jgi:transcriptional regulator NrdR family protein